MIRLTMDNISKIFPNMAAELDEDLGNVRIQLDSQQQSQEDELLEYFGRFNLEGSETTTPISDPKMELPKIECQEKKLLNIEQMFNYPLLECGENLNAIDSVSDNEATSQDKAASPIYNQYSTDCHSKFKTSLNDGRGQMEKKKNQSYKNNCEINFAVNSVKNLTPSLGSDKWVSEKEKFLDSSSFKTENNVENSTTKENKILGTVKVKESFIELPRIGRISKSFHGKSPSKDSYLVVELTPRRASDNMVNLSSTFLNSKPINLKNSDSQDEKSKSTRPKFCSQKSQPCPVAANKEEFRKSSLSEPQNFRGARFTTTLVDENLFLEGLKSSSIPNE